MSTAWVYFDEDDLVKVTTTSGLGLGLEVRVGGTPIEGAVWFRMPDGVARTLAESILHELEQRAHEQAGT